METTMTDDSPPGRESQTSGGTGAGQPGPPPPQAGANRPGRKLTRSRDDRVLGGIAGGIAHTYGWDPGLVRVLVAVAAVVTGGAIAVAYGIAWLVVPEDTTGLTGAETFRGHRMRHARENWALPVGIVLVAAGMLGVAHRFEWGPFRQLFWPITLIGGGLAVLLVRHRDPALTDDEALADHAGGPAPDEAPLVTTTAVVPAPTTAVVPPPAPPSAAEHPTAEQPTVGAYATREPWPTGEPVAPERPPRAPRERSVLGRLTWSALLLLVGGASLLATTGAVNVDAGYVIALALVVVGIALLAGAWFGRSRGLIALAIVLVAVCSVDAALDVPISGGIGERIYRVQEANNVQHTYKLAIGHLVVDLRKMTTADHELHVDARDAMGQLEIFLPANAEVDIRTRVGAGDLQLLGQPDNSGWRVDQRLHAPGDGPHFVIDARVGFGQLVVKQGQPS